MAAREERSKFQKAYIWSSYRRSSPELMPAERLWPLTNEALANGLFEEMRRD